MSFEEELEFLQKEFDSKVQALADRVRQELVVPVCKIHGLRFISGMGTFFFSKGKVNVGSLPTGYDEERLNEQCNLSPIMEILDLEVSHGQYLGYWVSDVSAKGK